MPDQPSWMTGPSFEAETPPAPMPAAFAFKVEFLNLPTGPSSLQCSFQEVSGMEHSLETEDVTEGGENRFVHQLPTRAKPRRLLLKRGLVERGSALMSWCREVLQWGLDQRVPLVNVEVQLMDADLKPLMVWTCEGAYPVRWTINAFESQRNEVALEEIELAYQTLASPT
jgi:phage tail-like protein